MIVLIHSAALPPVVLPDKESPHVQTARESRVAVAHVVTLYVVVRSWLIDKQATKMQPAKVVVGEAVVKTTVTLLQCMCCFINHSRHTHLGLEPF